MQGAGLASLGRGAAPGMADCGSGGVEIDVGPLEPEDFAGPEAGVDREGEHVAVGLFDAVACELRDLVGV